MSAQWVGGDGTTGRWVRVVPWFPSTQVFPDGRGMVRRRGGGWWRAWRQVDWVEKEPLPGLGVGWAVAGVLVGVVLGAVSRSRLSRGDS